MSDADGLRASGLDKNSMCASASGGEREREAARSVEEAEGREAGAYHDHSQRAA